tara:strand:- start:82 stop:918 length:837 start_codon:yes stop_codon:yes gene_type:complete
MNDLYSTSASAIANGNMRNEATRNYNLQVQDHNQQLSDTISGLKDKQNTANDIQQIKDTGTGLWHTAQMPSAIKDYKDYRAAQAAGTAKGANVADHTEATLQASAVKSPWTRPTETTTVVPPEPVNQRTGISLNDTEATTEEAGLGLKKGIASALNVGEDTLTTIGKGVGALGSAATAGLDAYEDIKGGLHLQGNNWEQKSANALQMGGALADVIGTVFPPAALIGGIASVTSGILGEIGDRVDADTSSAALDKTKAAQTLQTVSAPPAQTQVTGRVQ